jgi:hypothetical protein
MHNVLHRSSLSVRCYLNSNQAITAATRLQAGWTSKQSWCRVFIWAHPVSYSACTEGSFSEGVKWPGRDTDNSPDLVPMLRMSGDIPLFPTHSHGMHRHNIK